MNINNLNIGDTVYYRVVGNIWKGVILSKKKHLKIETMMGFTKTLKIEDAILPNEEICVIYQRFKKIESYRIERELYPHLRIPAKNICTSSVSSYIYTELIYGTHQEITPYQHYVSFIDGNIRELIAIPSAVNIYYEKYKQIIENEKLSVVILFYDTYLITYSIDINEYGGVSVDWDSKKIISYKSL